MYGYTTLSEAKYVHVCMYVCTLYLVRIMYVATHSSMHPSTPRGPLAINMKVFTREGHVYIYVSSNL